MFSLGSEIIILKQLYSQTNAATLMIQMDSYGWLLNGNLFQQDCDISKEEASGDVARNIGKWDEMSL